MDNSNNIFDTSSLTIKKMSDDDFYMETTSKLQEILQHEFRGIPYKQQIKKTIDGLNFACPFCGDSATDIRKKRAHFILKGNWAGNFKCFNCGKFMKIHNFFKSFDVPMSLSAITYVNEHVTNIPSYNTNSTEITSEVLDKTAVIQYSVKKDYIKKYLNLLEINDVNAKPGYLYLVNRCQFNFNNFLYDPKGQYIVILNLVDNDKVFGIQIRDITGKKKAKYLTMSLSKIHHKILKDNIEIPVNVEALSTVFNIFNIDIYRPVLVTEGPFDAFLLPNCIATSGASKSIGIDLPFWFVYDSDKTGNEHAMKMLQEGYNVFMWEKLKKDLGLPDKNPYSSNKLKWDINDVIKWCRDNNYKQTIYWSKYFSNDMLDGLDI